MAPRPLASIHEVAEYLGVTDKTLRAWMKRGYGPAPSLLGGQYRYVWAEVEDFVKSSKVAPSDSDEALEPCGCTGI